jgi:predicted branched-subunit amino acid permease
MPQRRSSRGSARGTAATILRLRVLRRYGTGCHLSHMATMSPAPATSLPSSTAAFFAGFRAAWRSVLAYVLIGTYIGIAALAHDFGLSLPWMLASTMLVWAGPGQVILVSGVGAGANPVETALAVGISSARLMPMVISLLPLIKRDDTRRRDLLLPAHLTAISMWIEAFRLLPPLPRASRLAYVNGLGVSFMLAAQVGGVIGFYLATSLPPLLAAGLLFLTPVSFLISTTRNCRLLADWLALGFGVVLGPLLAYWEVGLDLVWTGLVGGSVAYGIHRLRESFK